MISSKVVKDRYFLSRVAIKPLEVVRRKPEGRPNRFFIRSSSFPRACRSVEPLYAQIPPQLLVRKVLSQLLRCHQILIVLYFIDYRHQTPIVLKRSSNRLQPTDTRQLTKGSVVSFFLAILYVPPVRCYCLLIVTPSIEIRLQMFHTHLPLSHHKALEMQCPSLCLLLPDNSVFRVPPQPFFYFIILNLSSIVQCPTPASDTAVRGWLHRPRLHIIIKTGRPNL